MLRRLRQPENIALVIALVALVYALLTNQAVLYWRTQFWTQIGVRYMYIPVRALEDTVGSMSFLFGIGLLTLLLYVIRTTKQPNSKERSQCIPLIGMTYGFARWGMLVVVMLTVIGLMGNAVLNRIYQSAHVTRSTIHISDTTYQLIASRYDDGSQLHESYFVIGCDSFSLWCESLWVSPEYGWLSQEFIPIPASANLEFVHPAQLIIRLDDERFTVPLEPPA